MLHMAWGCGCFLVGLLVNVMFQISPEDAVSNTYKWIKAAGFFDPPNWLKPENVDKIVRNLAVVLMVIGALSIGWTTRSYWGSEKKSSHFLDIDAVQQDAKDNKTNCWYPYSSLTNPAQSVVLGTGIQQAILAKPFFDAKCPSPQDIAKTMYKRTDTPRRLTAIQKEKLAAWLKFWMNVPQAIEIQVSMNDDEAYDFADQIKKYLWSRGAKNVVILTTAWAPGAEPRNGEFYLDRSSAYINVGRQSVK